jgi:putative nucleotidyltransferase with HDIG domain
MKTREEALALWRQYNDSDALYKHALAVEAVMRRFAREYHEDEDEWALLGLLHDIDYSRWPEEHLVVAPRLLSEAGYDDDFIHGVISHGWGCCNDVKPLTNKELVLYTIDELCGLVTAAAYMRPSRSVMDMEPKSVKKKFKDKAFAAGVSRDIILNGCDMLKRELDEVIALTIDGMREAHEAIGL